MLYGKHYGGPWDPACQLNVINDAVDDNEDDDGTIKHASPMQYVEEVSVH